MAEEKSGGGLAGAAAYAATGVAKAPAGIWNALTRDGMLAAAGRQGADEIGVALKAFPDAIQTQEPGTIFNPTQGEIASSRNFSTRGEAKPSPSQIAKEKGPYGSDATPGYQQAQASKSPSEIARETAPAEQSHGQEHSQERSNVHGRGRG